MSIYFNNFSPTHVMYNGAEAQLFYNGTKIWPTETPIPIPEGGVKIGNRIWSKFYANSANCGVRPNGTQILQDDTKINSYAYSALRYMTPSGNWRVPTSADFDDLTTTIGATPSNTLLGSLFKTFIPSLSGIYTNSYGLNWYSNAQGDPTWPCSIGWYASNKRICGYLIERPDLYYYTSTAGHSPVVFVQDA